MPSYRSSALAVCVLAASSIAPADAAPTFTRITDPGNPVVTEMLETGGGAWADLDGDVGSPGTELEFAL